MLELQPVRIGLQPSRQAALERDGDVAEAEGAMAGVDECLRDDSDRVREVHDPGTRRGPTADELGEIKDDRHGAQRLGQAAGARRLLPDGAELERQGLVQEASRLAADAELDEDEVRTVHRGLEVAGQRQGAGPAEAGEHAPGKAPDDGAALIVDVMEDELIDRQPVATVREPLDQLGRVGASAPDDRDLGPHLASQGIDTLLITL